MCHRRSKYSFVPLTSKCHHRDGLAQYHLLERGKTGSVIFVSAASDEETVRMNCVGDSQRARKNSVGRRFVWRLGRGGHSREKSTSWMTGGSLIKDLKSNSLSPAPGLVLPVCDASMTVGEKADASKNSGKSSDEAGLAFAGGESGPRRVVLFSVLGWKPDAGRALASPSVSRGWISDSPVGWRGKPGTPAGSSVRRIRTHRVPWSG